MARSLPVSVPLPEGLPKRGEIFDLPSDEEGDEDSDIDTEGKYLYLFYLLLSIFNSYCLIVQNHLNIFISQDIQQVGVNLRYQKKLHRLLRACMIETIQDSETYQEEINHENIRIFIFLINKFHPVYINRNPHDVNLFYSGY